MDDNANNEKQMTFNSNDEEMTEEEYQHVLEMREADKKAAEEAAEA